MPGAFTDPVSEEIQLMNRPSRFQASLAVLLLLFALRGGAQGLFPVSIDEKISHSSIIVEGKVISQEGFWNARHTMIFTSNKVEVYKIFKGSLQTGYINVTTTGGTVGNRFMSASHLLTLEKNDIGVFFCRSNAQVPLPPRALGKGYEVYSSAQGFFKYDHQLQSASAPFAQYKSISKQLYNQLKSKTGKAIDIVNRALSVAAGNDFNQVNISNQVLAPAITSFSPATVTAGTLLDPANNIVTINGTGFGSAPASAAAVFFDNPDDGTGGSYTGVAYNSPLIVSWTDTQIKVRVPSGSGSGLMFVRDNAGNVASSGTYLNVTYNVLDASFLIGGNLIVKETRLVNTNGLGGYTVFFSSNTANNGVDITANSAKATFQRALASWKEKSGFNVTEGGSDTQQSVDPYDSTNMIMFDNSCPGNSPLPAGVLAICYSSGAFCPDNISGNQAYKPGFDVVIRNNAVSLGSPISFSYGPCSPYTNNTSDVDLESVLFHELGHAINMGHINDGGQGSGPATTNPQKVMNYALLPGLRRTSEDLSALNGASYIITPKGSTLGSCDGYTEMVPLATVAEPNDNCPAAFPTSNTPPNTTVSFDLVHATSNKFVDPSYAQVTTNGTTTGVTNTAYYAFKTNSTGGNLVLSVSGYSTVPSAVASCTIGPPGIPVTGVQLAIYQVAACPAGQSFPTPFASTAFQSDGLINISGLAANTNYLMFLDGVENTKALFSITFSGAALPLRITEFSGRSLEEENLIWWKTEMADNIGGMRLERSADGSAFGTLSSLVSFESDTYHDRYPLAGNNYYRLAAVNKDGSVQYSKVVVLTSKKALTIGAFPNPARGILNLTFSQQHPGNYSIVLFNTYGQAILQRRLHVTGNIHIEKLNTGGLAKGVYQLGVFGDKGAMIHSVTVMLEPD